MYDFFNNPEIKFLLDQMPQTKKRLEQMAKIQTNPQNMRSERKQKLKRVFNYDAEMKFLKSYYDLKIKSMPVEDFIELAKKTLVDTEQVSEVVFEFFVEELRINQQITEKTRKMDELREEYNTFKQEVEDLKNSLNDVEPVKKSSSSSSSSNEDSCSRSSRGSSIRGGC